MYDQSSALIASVLFVCILLAIEVGFRIGHRAQAITTESGKSQINAIQAAVLGVLALLLAFTFSLALQRHDSRSQAVVEEANAIGTAYLRSQLLPADMRDRVGALLGEYLDVRVQAGSVNLANSEMRASLLQKASQITGQLWLYARLVAEQDSRSVTTALFIQALNDMIDAYGERDAALQRHVPESVLFLLFLSFLMTGVILGYGAGVDRNRIIFPTTMMVALVVLLVFLIIDLDRPRRGVIQVNQTMLEELQKTIANSHSTIQNSAPDMHQAPH